MCIFLLTVALRKIDIKCVDILHAYLITPIREKFYTWAGPRFEQDEGKPFIVARALYGLKISGASFRVFPAETPDKLGFRSTIADPVVWRHSTIKHDEEQYYEYVLTYVDNIMVMLDYPNHVMKQVNEKISFKGNQWDDPEIYLKAKISKRMHNDKHIWIMSSQ